MKCSNEYEHKYQDYDYIIGIDEAGRGPIAGPLVVAGVCFPKGYESDLIYDSKKLSEKKREEAYQVIVNDALYYEIEIVSEKVIDQENIYRATQNAMRRIGVKNSLTQVILTDAMPLDKTKLIVEHIIKGDQKSVSIAAASILAKVTRDHIMYDLDQKYPKYGFKNHKGYPTKAHLEAIFKYGIIEDIYRKTYGPVQKAMQIKLDL